MIKFDMKLVLFTTCFCFPLAALAQGHAAEEQSIRALIAQYALARENQDEQQIRALLTEDADQLVSSGVWRRGREILVQGMLQSSRSNTGDRTITVENVRFITQNVGIADARYLILGTDGGADRRMWSTFVAVRNEGQWRLAAIRNMLPAPRGAR